MFEGLYPTYILLIQLPNVLNSKYIHSLQKYFLWNTIRIHNIVKWGCCVVRLPTKEELELPKDSSLQLRMVNVLQK